MGRLIDADALKEYMRKGLEDTRRLFKDNGEFAEIVTDGFCEDIDDQPTVEFDWIPCKEGLPTVSGKYLVTVRNGNVYAGTYSAYDKKFTCAAIAWKPLPEPYKEEDNGTT